MRRLWQLLRRSASELKLQTLASLVTDAYHRDIGDPTVVYANAGINRNKPVFEESKEDIEL
jgi:hypothetical protein